MKSTIREAEPDTLREQVESLTAALDELRRHTDEQAKTIAELTARLSPPAAGAAQTPDKPKHPSVTPEILAVITVAVTSFLGKKVRIRSARMLQSPYEVINPWAQQGRVYVQASHMLRRVG